MLSHGTIKGRSLRAVVRLPWFDEVGGRLAAREGSQLTVEPGFGAIRPRLVTLSIRTMNEPLYNKVLLQAPWHELC